MPEELDTMTVNGTSSVEVAASHADVVVTVSGSAAFGPDQAIARAREVSTLVAELQRAGIDSVEVLSVATHAGSGMITRSSAATYRVRVRAETIEQVPLVIDVVARQRNAGVEGVSWRYPAGAGRAQALREAVADAREVAATAAQALGVELSGVHAFVERTFDDDHGPTPRMMAAAAAESGPSLDIEAVHRKTVRVQVEVTYRIG